MIVAGVHAVESGDGPPVLVSSGLGGAWFDWEQVRALLPGPRVLVFDRPGLGESPASAEIPSLRREVDLLRALAEWLGEPVVLVAHSMAAFHAEALARIHPELVRGVVLVDPSCEPGARARRHLTAALAPLAGAVGAGLEITGLARLCGPWSRRRVLALMSVRGDHTTPPELIKDVFGHGAVYGTMIAENTAYPEMAADLNALRGRAPFPPVPLEVITALGGVGDPEHWERAHADLAAMSPLGRRTVLRKARHMVMLDAPESVAAAVQRVLS
ncbi:alpha/beta hydrolase [Actinocorallia longicatena]|uniref:Alpha/beta hydrolase n=1 Tax=Actinocorallia longicatena TaxID=111803 RepID=A0ABP6Q3L2_9ACTN